MQGLAKTFWPEGVLGMTERLQGNGVSVPPIAIVMFAHVLNLNLTIQSAAGIWSSPRTDGMMPRQLNPVVLVYAGLDKYYRTFHKNELSSSLKTDHNINKN